MQHPLDMQAVAAQLATPEGKAAHLERMTGQSVELPPGFLVTFSIERHPGGLARHMSMSSPAVGRAPSPQAVWLVCGHLGFIGTLEGCDHIWKEDLLRRGTEKATAINVLQFMPH